jgi:hypothetical protein
MCVCATSAIERSPAPLKPVHLSSLSACQSTWQTKRASQVKLLITNNAVCIVQRTTAQSKTGVFRGYGLAEAPPVFQAGWSGCTKRASALKQTH